MYCGPQLAALDKGSRAGPGVGSVGFLVPCRTWHTVGLVAGWPPVSSMLTEGPLLSTRADTHLPAHVWQQPRLLLALPLPRVHPLWPQLLGGISRVGESQRSNEIMPAQGLEILRERRPL